MQIRSEIERRKTGINHVQEWADSNIADSVRRFTDGTGIKDWCLRNIKRTIEARSMYEYYSQGNIASMKVLAARAAKLDIMLRHIKCFEPCRIDEVLWPILSDHEDLIDWYKNLDLSYRDTSNFELLPAINNPKHELFYRYQIWLALNSRWNDLIERCERVLALDDEIRRYRLQLIDHRFYLALAKGDISGMEVSIREKLLPRNLSMRLEQQSSLTHHFVDSYAVVFVKLAWRNGYELDIDSPWIPRDWLPIRPLDNYHEPWDFMRNFDIWQPLEGAAAPFSPKRNLTD